MTVGVDGSTVSLIFVVDCATPTACPYRFGVYVVPVPVAVFDTSSISNVIGVAEVAYDDDTSIEISSAGRPDPGLTSTIDFAVAAANAVNPVVTEY
jgi:hypothetical protein